VESDFYFKSLATRGEVLKLLAPAITCYGSGPSGAAGSDGRTDTDK